MLPVKTILHPTDFSENSAFAFRLACALARDYGAQLVIMHVAPPPFGAYSEGIYLPTPEGFLEPLEDELRKLQPHDKSIVTEHRLVEGEAGPMILKLAAEVKADVIVMGTHGRTGLVRLVMGSVAEQVVRKARCPVLTVKHPVPAVAPTPVEEAVAEPVA
jgi:nucleotide-binding universal stress UspA family protein